MAVSHSVSPWWKRVPRSHDDTPPTTCVVFSVPEKRLREMDVALGPCVPLPGRARPLRGALNQQGPETPEQMRALFVVLGGPTSRREAALELVATSGPGALYRCSDEFVDLMRTAIEELLRLVELDKANGDRDFTLFQGQHDALDAAWLKAGNWHRAQLGTGNRLPRMGWARRAAEKHQPLFCWYGPPVPTHVLVHGTGPYPGRLPRA